MFGFKFCFLLFRTQDFWFRELFAQIFVCSVANSQNFPSPICFRYLCFDRHGQKFVCFDRTRPFSPQARNVSTKKCARPCSTQGIYASIISVKFRVFRLSPEISFTLDCRFVYFLDINFFV